MYLFDELLVEARQRDLDLLRAASEQVPRNGGRVTIRAWVGGWLVRAALWVDPERQVAEPSVRLVTH